MRGSSIILALLGTIAFATAAEADCAGVQAVDRCLVGIWKQTGGGAEEWMRQNIHGARMMNTSATNNTITLKADGTFSTGMIRTSATVVSNKDQMRSAGNMTMQASGKWSAAAGKLNFCPATMNSSGNVQMMGPHGQMMSTTMPKMQAQNSAMTYTCSGNTMTTVKAMPHATAMTTIYTKVP